MADEKRHLWDKNKENCIKKKKNGLEDANVRHAISCEKEMEACFLTVKVSILLSLFVTDEVGSFFIYTG